VASERVLIKAGFKKVDKSGTVQKLMDEAFKEAADAAVTIMTEGIDSAMNKFNGKK
jgi:hypothetical protein